MTALLGRQKEVLEETSEGLRVQLANVRQRHYNDDDGPMKRNQDDEFRARGMHTKSCKQKKSPPHQRGD